MLSGAGAQSSVPDCSREGPSQPFGGTEARDYRQDLSRAGTVWESGPGPRVAVALSLGRRPLISRIRLLLRRLATATRDIRRGLESAYVNVADRFRRLKGDGP